MAVDEQSPRTQTRVAADVDAIREPKPPSASRPFTQVLRRPNTEPAAEWRRRKERKKARVRQDQQLRDRSRWRHEFYTQITNSRGIKLKFNSDPLHEPYRLINRYGAFDLLNRSRGIGDHQTVLNPILAALELRQVRPATCRVYSSTRIDDAEPVLIVEIVVLVRRSIFPCALRPTRTVRIVLPGRLRKNHLDVAPRQPRIRLPHERGYTGHYRRGRGRSSEIPIVAAIAA